MLARHPRLRKQTSLFQTTGARYSVRRVRGLLLIVTTIAACGAPRYPPSSNHALLGRRLPEIHHQETLDGARFDSGELRGKPVLVKFFADYCEPCKATLPAAERVHAAHPDVLFIGIDEDERIDTAEAVAKRFGLTFPVLYDRGNVLSGRFRVSAMPMSFVADADGVIRWVGDEGQTEADLTRAVEATR